VVALWCEHSIGVDFYVLCPVSAGVRAGHWFTVKVQDGITTLHHRPDLLQRAEPVICAFDIETTKLPLRFPNSAHDQVGAGKHRAILLPIC
jgi:DNA polymerase epsilon subunit 1